MAGSIHPEQCIKVLCPIVQTADYPINLAAIKMQTKAIERIAKEPLHQLLSDIIPGLLQVRVLLCTFLRKRRDEPHFSFSSSSSSSASQGYDNTESSVRKASVFCLVAIYSVIGEELKPYLSQLTGSKVGPLPVCVTRALPSSEPAVSPRQMKLLNLYIKRAQTSSNSSSSSDISSY